MHFSSWGDRQREADMVLRLIVIGKPGVGKRSLINRFVNIQFLGNAAFLIEECTVARLKYKDTYILLLIQFSSLDTDVIMPKKLREQKLHLGIIVAYDTCDQESFKEAKTFVAQVMHPSNAAYIIVGTKQDILQENKVLFSTAKDFSDAFGIDCIETSSKDNLQVTYAFHSLVRQLFDRKMITRTVNQDYYKKQQQPPTNQRCNIS